MNHAPLNSPLRGKGAALLGGVGPSAPQDGGSDLDIRDLLAQIFARKWLIAFCALIGGLVGAYIGQLPPDSYRATATIQIEKRDSGVDIPTVLIGQMLGTDSESSLATEIHVIRSRLIMGPVTERLNLDTRIEPTVMPYLGEIIARRDLPIIHDRAQEFIPQQYIQRGEYVAGRFTEVPEDQMNRRSTLLVTGPDSYALTTPEGTYLAGTVGEPLALGRFHELIIDEIAAPEGRVFTVWKEPVRRTVNRIQGGLSVRERGNSGIVDFTYTGDTRAGAIDMVNTIVAVYQQSNLDRRSLQIDQSIEFIDEQIEALRQELGAANTELLDYRETRQSQQLSVNTQQILDRAVALETQIENLNLQERVLAETLTPNHPTYRALIQERELAQERLDALRVDLETLPEAEQDLARLTRNVERLTALETQLVERREQLGVQRASTVGNIRVLEPAEEASRTSPSRTQPALFGLAIGAILATLLVLVLNFFRRGIDDAKAIEELGLPLFATVNKVDGLRKAGNASRMYALAETDPNHLSVEALRGLRTGLQFALANARSRSLMITSTAPNDGKSFVSFNLAMVMGQAGSRILLIDADMRKGMLRKQFGLKKTHSGLTDYLARKVEPEDIIVRQDGRPIDFIPTGAFPPNAADLLASDRFRDLIETMSQHYDLVIVDAPPVLAVTDPAIIGQHTGMSLLVVAHLITSKPEIVTAMKSLESSGVHLAGAVMNQFDPKKSRYGKYGAKYGYYGGYHYKYD